MSKSKLAAKLNEWAEAVYENCGEGEKFSNSLYSVVMEMRDYAATLKQPAAVALGSIKSEKKAKSSAENGKRGGRPKTKK